MTTTQRGKPGGGKPGAKARQRARRSEQKRQKSERPASPAAYQVNEVDRVEQDQVAAVAAAMEEEAIPVPGDTALHDDMAALESPATDMTQPDNAAALQVAEADVAADRVDQDQVAAVAAAMEEVDAAGETALRGDVLPPEGRAVETAQPTGAVGFQNIAEAYVDYARNSWAARRALVDRVMTTRSFAEAMEAQGDFAKQSCANFVAHSQKIGGLYFDFTRQFFRPLQTLATGRTRVGRG